MDLTEDSDWLGLDTSVPEEEVTESVPIVCKMQEQEGGQKDVEEEGKEVNLAINGNQEEEIIDRNKPKEVLEGQTNDGQEKKVSSGEGPVRQTSLKPQEEREEQAEDEGQEKDKTTNEILKEPTGAEQREEDQQEKDKDVTDSLNKVIELNPHHDNTAEEQQGQEDNLKPTALITDSEPPACQENQQEEAAGTEEQDARPSACPAKVLSAVERFQSPAPSWGFQVKTRAKEMTETRRPCSKLQSRENTCAHLLSDSNVSEENNHSEGHEEEEAPSVKVSELKKRFEA